MQPWIAIAVLAAASDFTGALHRKTVEMLAGKPAAAGKTVAIDRFHVAVDWRPFGSVEEAAGAEAAVDWFDTTPRGLARQEACTLGFAALELQQYLGRMGRRPAASIRVPGGKGGRLTPEHLGRMGRQQTTPIRAPGGKGDGLVITTLHRPTPEQLGHMGRQQAAPIRVPGGKGDGLVITTLRRLTPEQLGRMPGGIVEMLRGGPERFAVVPFEDGGRTTVILVGSDRVGALYAAYDFLERQGVRFIGLGESEEAVPQRASLLIPAAYSSKPGFGLRSLYGYRKNRGTEPFFSWMAKNKLNAWGADDLLPGMRKRGFQLYGGNHWVQPEAGIRGNVCLSDEPQTEAFVRNVVNLLADGIYKDLDILEYLPADWGVRCEEDNRFGSPTDRDVLLVHRLRKAIHASYEAGRLKRDVQVFFYAYFDTVSPPTRPLPPDFDYQRTSVGFYAMRCFNHALNDPSCNEAFVAYIQRAGGEFAVSRPVNAQLDAYLKLWTGGKTPWKGRVGYGDYYSMARLFQIPNPLMSVIAADIPYAHKLGVWDARYMHPTTSDWATKTLTNYQFAKMLWDPHLDVPALLAEYFRLRYGAAARPMCDFYFRLERAMANLMWLKGDFVDRFNRIHKMKDTLFIWDHLHLEPYQPAINNGVDLEESVAGMRRCRALLDQALASARDEAAQRRIREDDAWFQYSSHTIHFYYYMAKTYTRWVAGDHPGAVQGFAEAEKYAALLRAQRLPILVAGVHQPNQADGLEAARLMPAYEHFKKEFGGPPAAAQARPMRVVVPEGATPRVEFGAARLMEALRSVGYDPVRATARGSGPAIVIGDPAKDPAPPALLNPEGFVLQGLEGGVTAVGATGDSGLLYGCLELAARVRTARALPPGLSVSDAPRFSLRGPAIGMQRPEIAHDGVQYDYLYTPENFPFFYDRAHWTRYLDFLLENRMNTLYLWTGHPFTSLLELPRYPEARELAPAPLRHNIETFTWLTAEADKRGIWVIQKFYNIHISHALAKARNVPIVYSRPTGLASAYMRYAVSEFIRSYKHVGFMLCLGEALQDEYDAEWLTGVILPGVRDGMRALGITEEPPVIVRAHSTPIEPVMAAARQVYGNLLTMHKYNGEGLTTPEPRGEVRRLHESLAKLGSAHIVNVHLLSNLEPFRWGATGFIRQSMLSCQRMGAKGLHLYPLRYWDWPVTADAVSPPLLQIDRDWIWFEAWARYAWNPERDAEAERRHWVDRIALRYGSRAAAERIFDAYERSGEVSPRLLPRIGITTGARQTFALGMLMTQLIDPARYSPWVEMWEATAPPGERLEEWVKREWDKQPHAGETPPRLADELVQTATRAVADIEAAAPLVTSGREEFARLRNDVHAIRALARHYAWKVHAAASVLRYRYSGELADLDRAQELLDRSLEEYRELVRLTETAYRDANSLHAASRRIPFVSGPGLYIHWRQCLPEYEKEAAVFRRNRARLRDPGGTPARPAGSASDARASAVRVKALTAGAEVFTVGPGAALFTDRSHTATEVAQELRGLTGIRVPAAAAEEGLTVEFDIAEPARILVGFPSGAGRWAAPPKDEWDLVLESGVLAPRLPPVRVFSHLLPAGRNQVDFGKGGFVILGFVKPGSGAFRATGGILDWLFEEE